MNYLLLILAALAVLFVVRTLWLSRPDLTAAEAQSALAAATAVLVDVREPAEWAGGVAQPAVLLSFSDLQGDRSGWRAFLEKNRGRHLVLYCASGTRSGMAAARLRREGFTASNLGGLSRWTAAGLPLRQPN